jgi:predicted RNase H-like HicB family nuclease
MTASKTYTAIYKHDPGEEVWNVHIKGLAGCQTYGRSIRQAQGRIREALALWLDVTPTQLRVRDQFPAALAAVADDVVRARGAAERAGAKAQQQTIEAVKTLTELGLSRRDAAELLGLSHQRVHQLLEASEPDRRITA